MIKIQIDLLLLKKVDRSLFKDYKVTPSEILSIQHRLLVIDFEIKNEGKTRAWVSGQGLMK